MEIQQHDGVVVEVAGSRQGFAKLLREEDEVWQGEGGAKTQGAAALPLALLYIGPQGGCAALGDGISKGGRRPRGEGVALPPKARGNSPQGSQP